MLPLDLSTDIASLRRKSTGLVLACTMEIDHQGEIAAYGNQRRRHPQRQPHDIYRRECRDRRRRSRAQRICCQVAHFERSAIWPDPEPQGKRAARSTSIFPKQ